MPSAVVELLRSLATCLDDLELRWYVFGAQAVVVHGRPRATEDVDVTVDPAGLTATALAHHLEARGFRLAEFADAEFVAATRVLPFVHQPSGMMLDLVLAGPGLEEVFLDGAEPTDLGGVTVPVIRAEHLLVTKILGGRPKDFEDAREIVKARGDRLDLAMVRELISALESTLGQSDLTPLLDEILADE